MSKDSESLISSKDTKRNYEQKKTVKDKRYNDLTDMFLAITNKFSWKIMLFLFIIVLIVSSDIFIENVLIKLNKSFVNTGNEVNSNGTVMQALIISGSYAILSIFSDYL